jgi:hypothetical protein
LPKGIWASNGIFYLFTPDFERAHTCGTFLLTYPSPPCEHHTRVHIIDHKHHSATSNHLTDHLSNSLFLFPLPSTPNTLSTGNALTHHSHTPTPSVHTLFTPNTQHPHTPSHTVFTHPQHTLFSVHTYTRIPFIHTVSMHAVHTHAPVYSVHTQAFTHFSQTSSQFKHTPSLLTPPSYTAFAHPHLLFTHMCPHTQYSFTPPRYLQTPLSVHIHSYFIQTHLRMYTVSKALTHSIHTHAVSVLTHTLTRSSHSYAYTHRTYTHTHISTHSTCIFTHTYTHTQSLLLTHIHSHCLVGTCCHVYGQTPENSHDTQGGKG